MTHSSLKICSPSLDLLLHFPRFVWALSSPLRRRSLFSIWDDSRLFRHRQAAQGEMGKTGRRTENQGRGQGPRIRGQSTMMLCSAVRGLKSISRFIISLHTFGLRYAVIHAATIEGLFFYHVSLNSLTPLPLQPQLFRENIVLLSFLLWT